MQNIHLNSLKNYLPNNDPIIIIGMHRSGTSLVAKILYELGVHIGIELDINNESICFMNINKRLLQNQGAHWAKPEPFVSQIHNEIFLKDNSRKALHLLNQWIDSYGKVEDNQIFGWKDPRNTLTLPIWLEIFPHAKIIHIIRNGIDVALSLYRREIRSFRPWRKKYIFPPTIATGYRLWKKYLQIGLALESRCIKWLPLRYEDIISQTQIQINIICQFTGVTISSEAKMNVAKRIIRQPKKRSLLETIHLQLLLKMGLIDPSPLIALGYEPPA